MTNAWDHAKGLAEKHASQGGIFVKLQNDGDKVVGVFCGEPYAREVFWDGQKYADTAPEGSAARASLRVSLNFFVPTEGAMKVIEGGTAWFKDLLEVKDKYGLDKWVFEVKRRGKPKDPKTKYSILPDKPVDDALRAAIAKAPRHDLATASTAPDEEPGKTVDIEEARALIERLRILPHAAGEAFLKEFGIARVRDLLAADLDAAKAYVAHIEQPPTPEQQVNGAPEIDPFAI